MISDRFLVVKPEGHFPGRKVGMSFYYKMYKNKELVERLVEFLRSGMGIENSKIFCTSLNGTLPTGRDFVEIIKQEVKEREMVMALITPEYLKSQFCMMELGAAWVEAEYLCVILAGGVDYEDLSGSPLRGIQMRRIDKEEDLCAVYGEMVMQKLASVDIAQFNKKMQEFLQHAVTYGTKARKLICPDSDGYYKVVVGKERTVPAPYRCYKIKGRLDIETADGSDARENHWIFYKSGVYEDLKEGDVVLLKVGKTERRYFQDIGWARNIYPSEIQVDV